MNIKSKDLTPRAVGMAEELYNNMLHILFRGAQGTAKLIADSAKKYGPMLVDKGKELYYIRGTQALEAAEGVFTPGPSITYAGGVSSLALEGAKETYKFVQDNWQYIKHRGLILK